MVVTTAVGKEVVERVWLVVHSLEVVGLDTWNELVVVVLIVAASHGRVEACVEACPQGGTDDPTLDLLWEVGAGHGLVAFPHSSVLGVLSPSEVVDQALGPYPSCSCLLCRPLVAVPFLFQQGHALVVLAPACWEEVVLAPA